MYFQSNDTKSQTVAPTDFLKRQARFHKLMDGRQAHFVNYPFAKDTMVQEKP
jgi:hypothetical protein